MGIGESAGYQNFLLFLQCFPKGSSSGLLKVVILWEMFNHVQISNMIQKKGVFSLQNTCMYCNVMDTGENAVTFGLFLLLIC